MMEYLDAVMIVEKEIERHKRMELIYGSDSIKAYDERILIEALETVLKGNQDRISDNRDDSIDLKNYYDRAKDIAENILKGDKNDGT